MILRLLKNVTYLRQCLLYMNGACKTFLLMYLMETFHKISTVMITLAVLSEINV